MTLTSRATRAVRVQAREERLQVVDLQRRARFGAHLEPVRVVALVRGQLNLAVGESVMKCCAAIHLNVLNNSYDRMYL